MGKYGEGMVGFWPPNEHDLTFWVPVNGANFHQHCVIATVGEVTDRQTDVTDPETDRHTDANDFSLPMHFSA